LDFAEQRGSALSLTLSHKGEGSFTPLPRPLPPALLPRAFLAASRYSCDLMQGIKNWVLRHPSLAAWIALAVGMNAILIYEARDVGLLPMQWFWLLLITTLVAGACIWIVSWGDDEDAEAGAAPEPPAKAVPDDVPPAA